MPATIPVQGHAPTTDAVTHECYDLGVSHRAYDRLLVAMAEVQAEKANVVCHVDLRRERAPFVMPPVSMAA